MKKTCLQPTTPWYVSVETGFSLICLIFMSLSIFPWTQKTHQNHPSLIGSWVLPHQSHMRIPIKQPVQWDGINSFCCSNGSESRCLMAFISMDHLDLDSRQWLINFRFSIKQVATIYLVEYSHVRWVKEKSDSTMNSRSFWLERMEMWSASRMFPVLQCFRWCTRHVWYQKCRRHMWEGMDRASRLVNGFANILNCFMICAFRLGNSFYEANLDVILNPW